MSETTHPRLHWSDDLRYDFQTMLDRVKEGQGPQWYRMFREVVGLPDEGALVLLHIGHLRAKPDQITPETLFRLTECYDGWEHLRDKENESEPMLYVAPRGDELECGFGMLFPEADFCHPLVVSMVITHSDALGIADLKTKELIPWARAAAEGAFTYGGVPRPSNEAEQTKLNESLTKLQENLGFLRAIITLPAAEAKERFEAYARGEIGDPPEGDPELVRSVIEITMSALTLVAGLRQGKNDDVLQGEAPQEISAEVDLDDVPHWDADEFAAQFKRLQDMPPFVVAEHLTSGARRTLLVKGEPPVYYAC